MLINITGYITKTNGENGFTIKITSDDTGYQSDNNIHVSKEVEVRIDRHRYPANNDNVFERLSGSDDYRRNLIDKYRSLSGALRLGDRVKCSVYIVENEMRNGFETYVINTNRKDIQSYADFPLWLCPYDDFFERLEFDTLDTIKFRKQNYYTNINQKKCKEITGSEWNDYRNKWWINKNPKIIFPRIWGIRFRKAVSNLWERLTGQETLLKVSLIANIILAFITAISVALNIWLLFFKNFNPTP